MKPSTHQSFYFSAGIGNSGDSIVKSINLTGSLLYLLAHACTRKKLKKSLIIQPTNPPRLQGLSPLPLECLKVLLPQGKTTHERKKRVTRENRTHLVFQKLPDSAAACVALSKKSLQDGERKKKGKEDKAQSIQRVGVKKKSDEEKTPTCERTHRLSLRLI